MVRMDTKLSTEEHVMNGTRHTGTSVAVYKDLKEQILHLELPPGSAISEIDTAAAFHVSRTPVRDAFKMLEREGLLEVRPHIGTFVSLIDLNMISDILYLRETLEQAVLRDLTAGYDKSQEFRIRLLLQRQCELLEQDLPAEELGRPSSLTITSSTQRSTSSPGNAPSWIF